MDKTRDYLGDAGRGILAAKRALEDELRDNPALGRQERADLQGLLNALLQACREENRIWTKRHSKIQADRYSA